MPRKRRPDLKLDVILAIRANVRLSHTRTFHLSWTPNYDSPLLHIVPIYELSRMIYNRVLRSTADSSGAKTTTWDMASHGQVVHTIRHKRNITMGIGRDKEYLRLISVVHGLKPAQKKRTRSIILTKQEQRQHFANTRCDQDRHKQRIEQMGQKEATNKVAHRSS